MFYFLFFLVHALKFMKRENYKSILKYCNNFFIFFTEKFRIHFDDTFQCNLMNKITVNQTNHFQNENKKI